MTAKETVPAKKVRLGRADALALARSVSRVVASRGKTVQTFDLRRDRPSDDELLAAILGPTGNLRAPTIRNGKTLYVGFNADVYKDVFG